MARLKITLLFLLSMTLASANIPTKNDTTKISIKIIETTDVHGNFFPYDFINRRTWNGSLAQAAAFVEKQREANNRENIILLDNGDILQGQPTVYYYNFIDTISPHLAAEMMNYMKYDAATVGNHDIETGHQVYDRWISQCQFPVLGANIINKDTGKTYLKPYTIINRHGLKIAVLGLVTPAIPAWLPEQLWSGLQFDDMVETARKWISIIQSSEKPDLIVGLFHSGANSEISTGEYCENASVKVAREVPGFDIIFMGHDHSRCKETVINESTGKEVYLLNPANNANSVAVANVVFTICNNTIIDKSITTELPWVKNLQPTEDFNSKFSNARNNIEKFVSQKIGYCAKTITTRDAYFGPSAFIDFIHSLQLKLSNADISMAAPLSYDAAIKEGDIHMSDMFNLYKFENMLYVMELSGKEIKDYLEMSYDLWINTMNSAEDNLLQTITTDDGKHRFKNPTYNFDSAAGIHYTVDVTKPQGNRIVISGLADGRTFNNDSIYKVAINSYRGNGGGNLLTKGAGIPADELSTRIIWSTDIDLRYHLMKQIESEGTIDPKPLNHWKFIPEEIVNPAINRDRALLFP